MVDSNSSTTSCTFGYGIFDWELDSSEERVPGDDGSGGEEDAIRAVCQWTEEEERMQVPCAMY